MTEDSVLDTLRRVDDRIILAVMGRDVELGTPEQCVCGWVLREKLAEMENIGASRVALPRPEHGELQSTDLALRCVSAFGGRMQDWKDIYWGVCSRDMPLIELAFVRRVEEAVFPPKPVRARSATRRSPRRQVP